MLLKFLPAHSHVFDVRAGQVKLYVHGFLPFMKKAQDPKALRCKLIPLDRFKVYRLVSISGKDTETFVRIVIMHMPMPIFIVVPSLFIEANLSSNITK